MITLYSFCSPDRATGKTTMMETFLRDDAELYFLALQCEKHELRKKFPYIKRDRVNNLRSEFYRGLSHNKIDIVVTVPYLDSMKDRDFQAIKDACDYLWHRSGVNIYVESLNPNLVKKLISVINPNQSIFLDDYLNWDENHHIIGDQLSELKTLEKEIEKVKSSISDSGMIYLDVQQYST